MDLTSSATTPAVATTVQPPQPLPLPLPYDHQSQQQYGYVYDASYYQHYYNNNYYYHHQQQTDGSGSATIGLGQVQDPNFAAGGHYYALPHILPSGIHFPYQGGAPFRGGGRGKSAGRGRGRGGRHGVASSSDPESSAQPVRIAWCELCRVDCTSKEILEQHNNGKKHKKNLQKLQNIQSTCEPVSEIQKDENTLVQETEADVQIKIGDTDSKVEAKENDIQATKPQLKRKKKGSNRGGKRMKPTGPPRTKVVIPLMCDLCNVKCDTQEVFNRHTAGKKHMSKVKRFEGHQAMYGPTAVQALYPPNPLSQTLGPQPAYYGAPESYAAPPVAYMPPPQAQNPNPQLADAPLEFGTQKAVSEPQVEHVSTGETNTDNGVL